MADPRNVVFPPLTPVSEAVQEQIHFDTLWATVQAALAVYAGQRWSARDEDDPGVTLLQAFAYGVSDVSYRHTLPLTDLLTEKNRHSPPATPPSQTGEPITNLEHDGIFAPEFGPEWALTSSPVTLDDYRRAILDLTVDGVFCFRDVQIDVMSDGDSYQYHYNPNNYAFQFGGTEEKHQVGGQYWLAVTLTPGVDENKARSVLDTYLKTHRNLCEKEMVPQTFVMVDNQTPNVQLFLDDDLPEGEEMVQVVAQALWAINQALLPAPVREQAGSRLARGETAEQVYVGPRLEYGWLSPLPPKRKMVNGVLAADSVQGQVLSSAVVGVVPGINAVKWDASIDSEITVPENQQVQLWVDNDLEEYLQGYWDGKLQSPGQYIQLYKRGQRVAETLWEEKVVEAYNLLNQAAPRATKDFAQPVPNGRNRNPGFYRTVGASLPPVYGLQQAKDDFAGDYDAKHLLQFLRPFEQLLANRADQLKKLPRMLAFDGRDPDAVLWGAAQWPQESDDPLAFEQTKKVLGDLLLDKLNAEIVSQSQDNEKELAMLNYLLGYFGEHRAPRALNATNKAEFRHVQQGFLRQVTRLAYERASISISRVSALQRKVAARLGVGEALFDERLQADGARFPTQALPFYMIEHQELLPQHPGTSSVGAVWPTDQTVSEPTVSDDTLTLTLAGEAVKNLKLGQLIELKGDSSDRNLPTLEPLTAIVIHTVDPATRKVSIQLGQQTRLNRSVPLLTNKGYTWHWRVSQVWLKRVVYELSFLEKPDDTAETAILEVTPSFPVELTQGKRFALRPRGRWLTWPTAADLTPDALKKLQDVVVEVVNAEPLLGRVKVKWIASSAPTITEKPSLTASPVRLHELTLDPLYSWSKLTDPKTPYAWAMPYTHDRFAFTLSIVLNRAWLKGSQNPEALSQWIQDIVREEMPSHLKLQLHWLDEKNFSNFADKYLKWQNDSRPVGDQSFELLRLLGIGDRPVDERAGIGFARIVKTTESDGIEERIKGKEGTEREGVLKHESVVYVRGKPTDTK
ncbi:hypothetical protein [Serratia entomophila]|uniref:hypothetical protein n=1 Tax=Serratia entomophila TaxID=42906 RepID=UPI002179B8BD|nr:hypothetical protein [Serratia entomophila]CAI1561281.1 Uncharacterised protein [Serratia entomophila]